MSWMDKRIKLPINWEKSLRAWDPDLRWAIPMIIWCGGFSIWEVYLLFVGKWPVLHFIALIIQLACLTFWGYGLRNTLRRMKNEKTHNLPS